MGRSGIGEEWSGSNDGKSDGAESDRVESEFVDSVGSVENDGRQAGSDNFWVVLLVRIEIVIVKLEL